MNRETKTKIVVAFILGILCAVFVYHAYMVYTLRAEVVKQGESITQIVNFLNSVSKQSQPTK